MKLNELKALAFERKLVGIFDGIPNEVYHHPDCPGISSTGLGLVHKSGRHYFSRGEIPQEEPTKALIIGQAIHDLILLPETFYLKYAEKIKIPKPPKEKKKTKKELSEAVVDIQEDVAVETEVDTRTLIDPESWANIHGMAEQFKCHPVANQIMDGAVCEQSLFWYDKETGILCKCRPDIMRKDGIIADIKSTSDASFNSFRKSIVNFFYDRQSAFYLEGATNVKGMPYKNFVFICIEKEPPYAMAIYNLNEAVIEVGQKLFRMDLEKLAKANKLNRFGYPIEIQEIDMAVFGYSVDDR